MIFISCGVGDEPQEEISRDELCTGSAQGLTCRGVNHIIVYKLYNTVLYFKH